MVADGLRMDELLHQLGQGELRSTRRKHVELVAVYLVRH
jgi:hypothetical protein